MPNPLAAILLPARSLHGRDVGAGEQHVLQFDRSEKNHFRRRAARRGGGDCAGDSRVVDGAIEQGRRGEARAHLDHLDVEAALGKEALS